MARQFGTYIAVVPLGTTWDEKLILEDEDGNPINIAGLHARAQLRSELPDVLNGEAIQLPKLELTTAGYYDTPPAWPLAEVLEVVNDASGTILLHALKAAYVEHVSPTNQQARLFWSILLTDKPSTDVAPVVNGKVVFLRATTI